MRRGNARDGGYVTVFTLGVAMALVSVVGLVLDGGRAQRAQSDAFGAAAAASRAGAQELDQAAAVSGVARLDPGRAEQAVRSFLDPFGLAATVTVTDTQVTVTVTRHLDYLILPGGTDLDATATTRITQERAP
ncbi:MAG TPA: pilus assembly protein TadG-related protein [Acidimicrobiales bacterium]